MTQDNTFVSPNRSAGPKCGPLNPLFRPAGRMGDTSVLWESLLPKPASTPVHESTPGGRLSRERTPLRSRASHKNSHISSHNKSAPNQNARASSSTTHAKEGRTTSTQKILHFRTTNPAEPTPGSKGLCSLLHSRTRPLHAPLRPTHPCQQPKSP
jgi:hypothetical protein